MVSGIRKKYNAAVEHLKGMKGSVTDPHLFQTNLDAFVETARNITFVMQKEFTPKTGFTEWYSKKREMMGKDPLITFFNNKRTISVHEKPIETILSGTISLKRGYAIVGQKFESPNPEPEEYHSITATKYSRNFEDHPKGYSKKEVISLCEEYAIKLGLLVDECESNFP
jgi:hypothetical protein